MIELAGATVPFIVGMFFPSQIVLDYQGENYTFHFKDFCVVMRHRDCDGWVRDGRGWRHQVFIVKDNSIEKIRETCNHEMAHLLIRGEDATAEHEFIHRNKLQYEVCDRLAARLRT